MSAVYSGSLQRKSKAELQEIAQALVLHDVGTKEEIMHRIKKNLEDNSDELENDPTFAGLYTRRRRFGSTQPVAGSNGYARSSDASHFEAVAEEREPSPVPAAMDARDVSMMLPPVPMSPARSPLSARMSPILKRMSPAPSVTNSPVVPSPAKSIVAEAMEQPEVQAVVQMEHNFAGNLLVALTLTRNFLSNNQNLFVLSGLFDVAAILLTVHGGGSPYHEPIQTTMFALTHWAMPTIILPAIFGYLISFSSPSPTTFDTLSASIVKTAAAAAYPFPTMVFVAAGNEVQSLDVLGSKWRGVSAGVTLAFALAEAIANRPNRRTSVVIESEL